MPIDPQRPSGGLHWPEIDLRSRTELVVGRSRECQVALPHDGVSRRHARFLVGRCGVEIEDLKSSFGTTVNGTRVLRTTLKKGDLIQFGRTDVAYRFLGDTLKVELETKGFAIQLNQVGIVRGERQLLANVSLSIAANSFVGVLGPSGAGKSLLLGCLSTTLEPTSGQIAVDNQPLRDDFRTYYLSRLGVLQQTDLVFDLLSVRENMQFASELRLPKASSDEREAKIDTALSSVGLSDHESKPVSVLSGGQKKRLSMAIELLLQPRLLVLDEPTSGLDPGMIANLMDKLRALSRQGITVVMSTHTLDTLHYFDSVIVLAKRGESTTNVYQGSPGGLLPAFHTRTIADLFDCLSREGAGAKSADARAPADAAADAVLDSGDNLVYPLLLPPKIDPGQLSERLLHQAGVIARRTWTNFRRDKMALVLALGQPFALAGIIVAAQAHQPSSIYIHSFVVVAAIWLGMTLTVREFVRERLLYLRDRLAGLSPSGYLLGKLAFATGAVATQGILLFIGMRIFIALLTSTNAFNPTGLFAILNCIVALIVVGCGGAMIGLIVSALARSEQGAVALLPLLILPQIIFGRVSAGESEIAWNETDSAYKDYGGVAYVPIGQSDTADSKAPKTATAPSLGSNADNAMQGGAKHDKRYHRVISLFILSRPATAIVDMPFYFTKDNDPNGHRFALYGWEWIFLLTLTGLITGAMFFVFLKCERRWQSAR